MTSSMMLLQLLEILQDRLSDIGKIKTFEKEVNFNADKKRFWLEEIESIDSRIMNDSMPVSLDHFNLIFL
jgi:hypothetical protein